MGRSHRHRHRFAPLIAPKVPRGHSDTAPYGNVQPNKINVKASILYLRRREHDDLDGDDDYPITFCDVKSLGYTGSGDSIRGFDFPQLLSEMASRVNDHGSEGQRSGYEWEAFDVQSAALWDDPSPPSRPKILEPTLRQRIEAVRAVGRRRWKHSTP